MVDLSLRKTKMRNLGLVWLCKELVLVYGTLIWIDQSDEPEEAEIHVAAHQRINERF